MSATLTWRNSGLGTKTGITTNAFFADVVTLITSKSGDANFSWVVASSNSAATPFYIVLKRKDGSPGRILFVCWTSAPAGNNPALLETSITTSYLYVAYFPNGNVDTPSNLTASSGTVMGDDTGTTKVAISSQNTIPSVYSAGVQVFYFDSAEAVFLGAQDPASASSANLAAGAGYCLVDASDNVYPSAFGFQTVSSNFGGSTSGCMAWVTSGALAGSATCCMRISVGGVSKAIFQAWKPGGVWASQGIGINDILTDTANSKVWFVPMSLLSLTKGEGIIYKMRQIGLGPGTTGPFTPYNTTGPVTQAIQFNACTSGGVGFPWLTNFKL